MIRTRWNNLPLGFILGLLLPVIVFVIIYYVQFSQYNMEAFMSYLFGFSILTKVMSLCVLPNLGLFFLFIRRNYLFSARGILLATITVGIGVFVLKFALQ
ncbi:MAG: hypothetical protein R6U66_06465 [Bacteroidales bacterium]|jgi:hypothetical protein